MFNWYQVFNRQAFLDTDLVSREFDLFIEGVGQKTVLVTRGVGVSMLYDGAFMMIGLNDKNPFRIGEYAAFVDEVDDVWLGIYNED